MIRTMDGTEIGVSMGHPDPQTEIASCTLSFLKGGARTDVTFRANAEQLFQLKYTFEALAMQIEDELAGDISPDPGPHLRLVKP